MKKKNIKKQKKVKSLVKSGTKQKLPNGYTEVQYNITWEPIQQKEYPEEVAKEKDEIHELLYSDPKKALLRLKEFKEKYSDIPELYNWLGVAQAKTGDIASYEATAKESYEKHPDYLFAKITYADICLNKGKLDEIPIIFDNKFELSLLYPHRDTFHISEVISFFGTMAKYRIQKGEIDLATTYYNLISQLDPDHQITKNIESMLSNKKMFDNLNSMFKKLLKRK